MRANRVSAHVFVVAVSLVGCANSDGDVAYSGQVRVTSPELVEIDSGVMVVADADEPLFYSEGNYWLYRDGYWLRSSDYRGGFVRVDLSYVPQGVRGIDRPQTYVQYRRQGRDLSARATQQPMRSRAPSGTYDPPPNQGAPSTPPAETWQQPRTEPTQPTQTPPITAPGDIHGNPMPPHQVPPGRPPGPGRPGPQPIPPE